MAFTVETGTGVTGANAYVSVANADSYHADRGNSVWASASSANKQAALVRASQAVDAIGHGQFLGDRFSTSQGLAWPRSYAYDRDGIELSGVPTALVGAVCEGALVELANPGALTPNTDRQTVYERVEDAVAVRYREDAYQGTTYRAFLYLFEQLLRSGGSIKVSRV